MSITIERHYMNIAEVNQAPTAYVRTAANTRKITNELRDITHYLTGRARYHATSIADVDLYWLEPSYNKTHKSFLVEFSSATRAGCPIMIHPESGTYWIRPARRADGSVHTVDKSLREMAAETRYLDVLLETLDAGHWAAEDGSETLESLTAWRESRRGQF